MGGEARCPCPLRVCRNGRSFIREPTLTRLGRARLIVAEISVGHLLKLRRREFLHLASGAAAVPAVSPIAWAQTYPAGAVRLVVGFAAGGGQDISARLMGQWLSERLGETFFIENRPGAATRLRRDILPYSLS